MQSVKCQSFLRLKCPKKDQSAGIVTCQLLHLCLVKSKLFNRFTSKTYFVFTLRGRILLNHLFSSPADKHQDARHCVTAAISPTVLPLYERVGYWFMIQERREDW